MDELRMAACGIPCEECNLYKVTIEPDLKIAESLVEWFKGQGWIGENEGAESIINKNPLCYGCWYITDECFWKCGCGSRDFRKCCMEKQINHCGECNEFPCEDYIKWSEMHEGHKKAMEQLKTFKQNN
jgi:hypothetical protein